MSFESDTPGDDVDDEDGSDVMENQLESGELAKDEHKRAFLGGARNMFATSLFLF